MPFQASGFYNSFILALKACCPVDGTVCCWGQPSLVMLSMSSSTTVLLRAAAGRGRSASVGSPAVPDPHNHPCASGPPLACEHTIPLISHSHSYATSRNRPWNIRAPLRVWEVSQQPAHWHGKSFLFTTDAILKKKLKPPCFRNIREKCFHLELLHRTIVQVILFLSSWSIVSWWIP